MGDITSDTDRGQGMRELEQTKETPLDWNSLVFGSYNKAEIALAVRSPIWQVFREDLRDRSLPEKFKRLKEYVDYSETSGLFDKTEKKLRNIRVTNYVHALARGGMIPPASERI